MSLAEAVAHRPFVPFITAGDPNLKTTREILLELSAWAGVIEVGVPFSDPVADGPVIQAADQRALASGASFEKIVSLIERMRREGFRTPVILFTYLNPALHLGDAGFARRLRRAGIEGALVLDLPAENAGCVAGALKAEGVEPVLLASPTTSPERLKRIGALSGSVVYYVSREGVTGARRDLAPGLARRVAQVRRLTGKPLLVGFGVSTPAQARAIGRAADGVVVGSALVAEIAKAPSPRQARARVRRFCRGIVNALGDHRCSS